MSTQARIAAILEECLEALEAGESLEACMARHPGQAKALRPLLVTILQIEKLGSATAPRPAESAARGRAEFLAAVAHNRQMQEDRHQRRFPVIRLPKWNTNWSTAFAALLMIVVLTTGTVAVSAGALPGDMLYPVKRVTEQVQVLLTINAGQREILKERLDERHRQEVIRVLAVGRAARALNFAGYVESISPTFWEVNGLVLEIQPSTLVEGQPGVGDKVIVNARAPGDGRLLAVNIRQLAEGILVQPVETVTPTASPTRIIDSSPTPTQTASPSRTPEPIRPVILTRTPTPRPKFTATPSATNSPTLTPTASASPTPTPTASTTPTAIPQPPTRVVTVRFEGELREKGAGRWMVGARTVLLPGGTPIDETKGSAQIGSWVQVSGEEQPDGAVVARNIVVLTPAEAPGEPYEFTDIIEAMTGDLWTVGGVQVHIGPGTIIGGATPAVGRLAHVQAIRRPNGEIWANRITVIEPQAEEVDIEGVIEKMETGRWQVSGTVVLLDGQTAVSGTPQVGKRAQIHGLAQNDGAVLARRITIVEPTPTATPISPVTPSPSPTATAIKQITPSPTTTPLSGLPPPKLIRRLLVPRYQSPDELYLSPF